MLTTAHFCRIWKDFSAGVHRARYINFLSFQTFQKLIGCEINKYYGAYQCFQTNFDISYSRRDQ